MALSPEDIEEVNELIDVRLESSLDTLYSKFQAWALRWFKDTASSAILYFESFFGSSNTTVQAGTTVTDQLFSPVKSGGTITIDQAGKFPLESDYSSIKFNIAVQMTNPELNADYMELSIKTRTYKGNAATDSVKKFIVDTSLPLQTFEYTYDLDKVDAVQMFWSTDAQLGGACTIGMDFSLLGYLTKKGEE